MRPSMYVRKYGREGSSQRHMFPIKSTFFPIQKAYRGRERKKNTVICEYIHYGWPLYISMRSKKIIVSINFEE